MAKFIVIEGTDGCGKQTQTELLAENLRNAGRNVIIQSFPNYNSASSGPVKLYLDGKLCERATDFDAYKASVLFIVDRLCTITKLEKELDENDIVIFDRYVESNLIYHAPKIASAHERNKFIKWDLATEYEVLGLPKPTMVFFLNMPPEMSYQLAHARGELKTGGAQDIHEKDAEYLTRCWHCGLQLANNQGWTVVDCAIDGQIRTREDIADEIYGHVDSYLKACNLIEDEQER